jgi:hypothetical protein
MMTKRELAKAIVDTPENNANLDLLYTQIINGVSTFAKEGELSELLTDEVKASFVEAMQTIAPKEILNKALVEFYENNYTEEELREILAVMTSPAIKKMQAKMMECNHYVMESVAKYIDALGGMDNVIETIESRRKLLSGEIDG